MGLVAGALWYLLARDKPEEHSWVKPAELAHIRPDFLSRKSRKPWRGNVLREQKCAGRQPELFLLRICRLHFLRLVFHLPEQCARPRFEVQFVLRHASFHRHGFARRWGAGSAMSWASDLKAYRPLWNRCRQHFVIGGIFGNGPWPMTRASLASCWQAALEHYTCHRVRFGQSPDSVGWSAGSDRA